MRTLFFALLTLFNVTMISWLQESTAYLYLDDEICESEAFRSMKLGPPWAEEGPVDCRNLALQMAENGFDLTGFSSRNEWKEKTAKKPENGDIIIPFRARAALRSVSEYYEMLNSDLVCFPVPESRKTETPDVVWEDSWQQARTYGGQRGHEGCDIMGAGRERGFYPVISISSGVVEKKGWLEQGGWRIGIRTSSGIYVYYAHLYSYAPGLEEGDRVTAGQLLGFMGDSGYGKEENTVGNFPVHLHLGIYLPVKTGGEISINPYWILKRLEHRRPVFVY